jgi:hypothetical protein
MPRSKPKPPYIDQRIAAIGDALNRLDLLLRDRPQADNDFAELLEGMLDDIEEEMAQLRHQLLKESRPMGTA